MYRVMYKDAYQDAYQYVADRDGVFYYVRRVPYDVRQHYASSRISFSLRTKSHQSALRAAKSVTQRLEDYWLGLRLQQMDIPAIHLVKADDMEVTSPLIMDAVEMYLSIKGKDDRTFMRTARRNGEYVSKVLGNRPITSYSSSEVMCSPHHLSSQDEWQECPSAGDEGQANSPQVAASQTWQQEGQIDLT